MSRKLKLDPYVSPCIKINSKWMKDPHVRTNSLKLLQEDIGKTLEDICRGNSFLNWTPIAQKIRAKIDKWDFIK
jgi:hypothetical protein